MEGMEIFWKKGRERRDLRGNLVATKPVLEHRPQDLAHGTAHFYRVRWEAILKSNVNQQVRNRQTALKTQRTPFRSTRSNPCW